MVQRRRKIIWTKKANSSRKDIFKYWNNRNKYTLYSKKLNNLFLEALKMISEFPDTAVQTQRETIRLKVVRDYQLIYQVTETEIILHYIWDTRQNPDDCPIK